MTKVLVTGGAGFIGHSFINYLLQHTDSSVVCLDRLDPAGDQNRLAGIAALPRAAKRLAVCYHDLRSELNTEVGQSMLTGRGAFSPAPFDHVVHMAAGSHVDRSVKDPVGFILDNVVGTANLFEYFRKHNSLRHGGKILYFSTDEVFGPAPDGVAYGEWDRFNPNNPYAASKAGGEAICTAYANTYGLPIVVTHTTNVYGESQHAEKFIPLLIDNIWHGRPVEIHADPSGKKSSSRYYTYVDNVSSALLTILERGRCLDGSGTVGKYNISGSQEISNLELAKLVAGMLGRPLRYEMVGHTSSRPKHDMRYAVSDTALAELGWKPSIDLHEGLRRVIAAAGYPTTDGTWESDQQPSARRNRSKSRRGRVGSPSTSTASRG